MCSNSPGKARGKCPSKKVAHEFSYKPMGGYRKKKNAVPFPRRNSSGFY